MRYLFKGGDGCEVFADIGYIVYEKLGYEWATSLLGFLPMVMVPFP